MGEAINKVVYGSNTLIDLTSDTVTASTLKTGITAHDKSGDIITGTMPEQESTAILRENYDANGAIVKDITTLGTIPLTIVDTSDSGGGTIREITADHVLKLQAKTVTTTASTASFTADSGYDGISEIVVHGPNGTLEITENGDNVNIAPYASANINVPTSALLDTKTIITNGTYTAIDDELDGYSEVVVNVGGGSAVITSLSITPSESTQTFNSSDYDGYKPVTVAAVSSDYIGSNVPLRSSTDLTTSGNTVSVPSGYYSAAASKSVAAGSAGTPTATKGSVSGHSISITPSVTNTTGYITGSTINGTPVTVTASELVSGTKSITSNGTDIDVINYASVDVSVDDSTFIITLSWDDDYFDEGEGAWVPDKTYTEIQTAYNAGRSIVVNAQNAEESSADGGFNNSEGYLFYSVRWLASVAGGDGQIECFYQMTSDGVSETNRWEYIETPYDNIDITSAGVTDVTNYATATVPSGTAGTPTATKGTVSNHSVSVTPSVTNTTGYITGSTKTGTAVSVSASELVSGTVNITSSGNTDVTNYATASVASGSATASATKGTVSNHSVSVTPSVTRTAGYITAGSSNGTSVTVSASELVSGSETKTANGTYDVTNLAQLVVNVQGGSSGMVVATSSATLQSANTSISFTGLSGEPTSFVVMATSELATGASPYKTASVVFDGTDLHGQIVTNTNNAQASYSTSFTKSYSNGTLTITGTGTNFQATTYSLVYTYGGSSANIGTADVQVGSGATSITFTGLTDEPDYFSCIFKSNFGTSSGYQRVMAVANDDSSSYGMSLDSSGKYSATNFSYTYNNGSLTISSQGTNAGGYFHQPGYYQLTYGVGGEAPEITIEPLSVTENGTYTAPRGKAYTPVTVNVSGGGSLTVKTATVTHTATSQTLSFSSLSGQPKYWYLRITSQLSSSGSTTYYYITNLFYDGTNIKGNSFRIGSTRRIYNVTSGITQSYNSGTLTITGGSSAGASPGQFYGASNFGYELVYIY